MDYDETLHVSKKFPFVIFPIYLWIMTQYKLFISCISITLEVFPLKRFLPLYFCDIQSRKKSQYSIYNHFAHEPIWFLVSIYPIIVQYTNDNFLSMLLSIFTSKQHFFLITQTNSLTLVFLTHYLDSDFKNLHLIQYYRLIN